MLFGTQVSIRVVARKAVNGGGCARLMDVQSIWVVAAQEGNLKGVCEEASGEKLLSNVLDSLSTTCTNTNCQYCSNPLGISSQKLRLASHVHATARKKLDKCLTDVSKQLNNM